MSATSLSPAPTVPLPGRTAVIVGSVVLLHAVALWALQRGLVRPPAEVIVQAQILAELIAPPPPPAAPPAPTPPPPAPPAPASPPPPKPRPAPPPPKPRAAPPRPAPVVQPRPAAPVVAPAPTAPAPVPAAPEPTPSPAAAAAPAAPAPSPPAPPAPPVIVQPSTSAAHLNNPAPTYPAMSKRLGESGRVVVRVLIGPDGRAQDARIHRSSGFDRLDQVALETARDRWRYVPGTRNGVPEAMWFNVPLNFVLE